MITGVRTKHLVRHPDDRGFFQEILRDDEGLIASFGQASLSKTYPGTIKAFHYHKEQDDLWFFPVGHAQVVLHDLRIDSPTFGVTDIHYLGEDSPKLLLIPVGVAHGYRTLGTRPALIVYFTTRSYRIDAPDEYRIPYDDPSIGFDWRTQNR